MEVLEFGPAGVGRLLGKNSFQAVLGVRSRAGVSGRIGCRKGPGIRCFGAGRFGRTFLLAGGKRVELAGSGRVLEAGTILIATGGRPFIPDIPGRELGITSDEAFNLPVLPHSILIQGGGYVAVEFATVTPWDTAHGRVESDDGRRYRVHVAVDTDPEVVIAEARARGDVIGYGFSPPDLSEIFLAAVGRDHMEPAVVGGEVR